MAAASSVPRARRSLTPPSTDRQSLPSPEETRPIDRRSAALPRHRVPPARRQPRLPSPPSRCYKTARQRRGPISPRRSSSPSLPPSTPRRFHRSSICRAVVWRDGDPDDTPGLLVALRASQATAAATAAAEAAREEAEITAAIQAAEALAAADQSPTGIDEPLSYDYPLMLNWSELKTKKRDEYDSENGRGHGKFNDIIGEDHRQAKVAKEGTVPEVEAQTETSKRNGGASEVINIMKQIHKNVLTLPTKCAEIVIERLKKEGLIYKPSFKDINPEENGVDESEVYVKRKYASKYFPEVDSSLLGERQKEKNNASFTNMPIDEELNDDTGARINGSGICTPNDPFIVNGNNSPVRSSSSIPTNEFPTVTRTLENGSILILDNMQNDVSPMGSEASIDKLNKDVHDVKRVRKASRWLKYPYEQMDGRNVMDYLDPEHIEAANGYINTLIENGTHRKDIVVKIPAADVDICTADMLGDIIKKKWLCGAVINAYCKQIQKRSKVADRHILSTWVSKWLLDRAGGRVTGRKTKMELLVKRTTTISRVMDEYSITDKKEFQVLDSLGPTERNIRKTIRTLKAEIARDIADANKQVETKFPDVSSWLIVEYEMPKQTDGVSFRLFVVRCIEYWDGEKWTSTFDQEEINASRSRILAELIFSKANTLEKAKHKVLRLISQA
ncbi:hypothetical protein ZWY2020_004963 [Hordeum vulgare]|nr:hypothetical protein ZWY2020_004963 [Hordeum vulgare]